MDYFQNLLGTSSNDYPGYDDLAYYLSKHISSQHVSVMEASILDGEILFVLKSMKKNKSLAPDGFNVNFFLQCWDIICYDFTFVVTYFFNIGHLPNGINATTIALIPKTENPSSMSDFRPISCCNTIYKCISKIHANHLK